MGNFTSVTTNGSTQTSTFNQQNEITSISGQGTPTYDGNGNLTADGSGNTYVYDAWNELVAVKNSSGTTIAAYGYDGLGRRITVMENGTTTDLYYSSADQVVEEDVSGVAQARNVWSLVYVNALILRDQSSQHNGVLDQRLYVQQDANWNVTALVDTSGNVVERYDYLPYGSITVLNPNWVVISESAYNVPFGYQGMGYDWTVGLNYSRTREYDPVLMRWLETDPLGFTAGDSNLYRYVGDNPSTYTDPSGEARGIINKIIEAIGGVMVLGSESDALNASPYGLIGRAAFRFSQQFEDERMQNAARHAYWQAYLRVIYGAEKAQQVGNLHELGEEGISLDSIIDQYNNKVGRDIGARVICEKYNKGWDKIPDSVQFYMTAKDRADLERRIEEEVKATLKSKMLIKSWDDRRLKPYIDKRIPRFAQRDTSSSHSVSNRNK